MTGSGRWWARVIGAVVVIALIGLWELSARTVFADRYVVSPPSAVVQELWTDRELYLTNGWATTRVALLGFVVGQAIAIVLAVLLSLSTVAELLVTKLALVVYSVPTLAIAPILGQMFGLGGTRIAVVALIVFFPTLLSTVAGLRAVNGGVVDVVTSLGGSRWTTLRRVGWRAALPEVFSGLKLGVPGAVLGAIASEWLGSSEGLGIFMVNALAYLQPARVWGTCVVLVVGTLVVYGVLSRVDRALNGWAADPKGAAA